MRFVLSAREIAMHRDEGLGCIYSSHLTKSGREGDQTRCTEEAVFENGPSCTRR